VLRGTENADERGVRGANDVSGETDRMVGDVSRAVGKVPD